jgi:phage terminase small subunit
VIFVGQNAKPVSLHIAQGNPTHLSKAEIKRRKDAEVKLGEHRLVCPAYIKRDVVAYGKWREIIRLYKDFDFVSSGDVGLLGRYCKTFSEYYNLVEYREKITNVTLSPEDEDTALTELEEKYEERRAAKLFEKIDFIMSAAGVLSFDTAINKKMDMLIKMEDRMFLSPLAKLKNIPKRQKVDKDSNADLFD